MASSSMYFAGITLMNALLVSSVAVPLTPKHHVSVPLSKVMHVAPTRSRVAEAMMRSGVVPNGSSIPAGGSVWPTAIYWSMVQIGTPPKNFPVAIDSGSGDLDVSGAGCDGCVLTPPNNQYDHTASSTSRATFPYAFSNSYQTCDLKDPTAVCTISGKQYTDDVSLAGLGPVKVSLGSIEKQTSNFDQFKEIDGVMGFTMGGEKNVFTQLVANKKCENIWAICMAKGEKSNGTLTIGGVDPRLSDNVSYVPDTGMGFHSVKVESIVVESKTAHLRQDFINAKTASAVPVGASGILDTGTNILLVPQRVLTGLHDAICADSSLPFCSEFFDGKCVDLTSTQLDMYPKLKLMLDNGVSLEMNGLDYLLQGSPLASSPDQFCLGIRDGGSAGGSGFIIGDTTMRNYYLVFDLASKRIGWGPVSQQCGNI